jgi:hypothetical protein
MEQRMTGLWSIVIPEATKNYLANPSFENGLTGITSYATGTGAGSRALATDWQKRGVYSYKISRSAGGASDRYGFYQSVLYDISELGNHTLALSVDLQITSGTVELVIEKTIGGVTTSDAVDVTVSGRASMLASIIGAATDIKCYVNAKTNGTIFYADGMMLEIKLTATGATTYCDGDQPGCTWDGPPHASTSQRSAQSRAGGLTYNLDVYSTYITGPNGIGMPKIKPLTQPQVLLPGAAYMGQKIDARTINLLCTITGSSLLATHQARQALINATKDDLVSESQPVILRYTPLNSTRTIQIPVYYIGGLEGGDNKVTAEDVVLQLLAPMPLWAEDGDSATLLTTTDSVSNANYAIRRKANVWTPLSSTFNGSVFQFARAADGTIYIGGAFTNLAGIANADGIAQYNPQTGAFTALGTGVNAGGQVLALAVAPDGTLYAGGTFTSMGGVANTNRIAKWDGANWTSISSSANDNVRSLAFDHVGTLYVGGLFTTIGGSAFNRIATYTPSTGTWAAVGTGTDGSVLCVRIGPDGMVYVCGSFANAGGNPALAVAKWNGTAWSALGAGFANVASTLVFGPDGTLYIGGLINTSGTNNRGIYAWTGSDWETLGSGIDDAGTTSLIWSIGFDERGLLYASGLFSSIGGLSVTGLAPTAVWNGSVWARSEIPLPAATIFEIKLIDNVLYLGFNVAVTATVPGKTTVYNTGSRTAYPKLVIKRSGGTSAELVQLINETTGKILRFNYSLLNGETLTLDLTPGARSCISSVYGNVWRAVLRNSDTGSFALLSNYNTINALVITAGSPTVTCYLEWQNTHWSADGGAA